ncbi:MAG: ABC transporter ATP-binding protein, partial [Candidatus Hodarchaeota archaeon]
VGESGCGKTTVGRTILQLIRPIDGKVFFEGVELSALKDNELIKKRRDMQMVFQNPILSLNPRMLVRDIVGEPLKAHLGLKREELDHRVLGLLKKVGLEEEHLRRFPHEFSGGQCQRIGIARAIALNPKFLVLDEPTSALDVSVQAQILNLLFDLKEELGMTYLFISHDLSVIEHVSDRIAVMYLGKIVELGTTEQLFGDPLHPYTKALLAVIPIPDPTVKREEIILRGTVPSPENPPPGCRFHTRCPVMTDICKEEEPELREVGGGRFVACHLVKS